MDPKPRRERERDLLVFPWAGIVTNIPGTCDPEFAGQQVEQYLSEFEPQKVFIVGRTSKQTWLTAVVQFKGDIHGYMNSVALDRFFQERGRSRPNWASASAHVDLEARGIGGTPSEWCLYGWMATKDDLSADDELGCHLSNRGTLSTVAGVVEELVQRNIAGVRALKEAQRFENGAEAWKSGRAAAPEMVVVKKETKDLETLITTLIDKVDGVSEAMSTNTTSSPEEDLCLATEVLQRHGPSPGISFKNLTQPGHCALTSESLDAASHGDQPACQFSPCGPHRIDGAFGKESSKLLRLKKDWGDEIFQKFMNILADYEGSDSLKGSSRTPVAWNTVENRKATLSEVIKGLEQVIEAKDAGVRTQNTEETGIASDYGKLQAAKVIHLAEEELKRQLPLGELYQEELNRKDRLIELGKQELVRKSALIAAIKEQLSESIHLIRTSKEELQRKNSLIEAQSEELQVKNQDLEAAREELRRKESLIDAKDLLIEARRNAIEKKDYLNKTLSLELKLKNHLLEAKREELRRKDLLIKANGLDPEYPLEVKVEDPPNGMSQIFGGLIDSDTDAERRYPKRTRN